MAPARATGSAFFPLDEQLGLLSEGLTPRGEEMLARLASWMPFEPARDLLQDLLGIQVSKATARRVTLQTGEAALVVCEDEVERLKQEMPQAPQGADKQAMSADGAIVHLVGGEWVEVKTLVIGEVTRNKRGEVCTRQVSSFSRLAEAEGFAEAALVETHRRGLGRAVAVCAVQDGAGWLIGSGSVESANKGVVEACLKGAGMRLGRQNVNSMLVVPNSVCNRQWTETWAASVAQPARSHQLVILALAIPGANLFSDALLPPLRFQERRVQKKTLLANGISGRRRACNTVFLLFCAFWLAIWNEK